ncbi:sialin-like isoform X2 [Antedon mediterranea]
MVKRWNATTEEQNSNVTKITYDDSATNSLPTFDWDDQTQQQILGSFYYGFIISGLPGGWLAGKIGGKRSIVIVLLLQGLLSAMIPWAAGVGTSLLTIVRVLQGVIEGLVMPGIYMTLSKWIVPSERSTLVSMAYSGSCIAEVCCYPLSTWISTSPSLGGWPTSYYTYSFLCALLAIVCIAFVYDDPVDDPYVSTREVEYLKSFELEQTNKDVPVPWCDIFTSTAVWSIIVAYMAFNFSYIFILTEGPSYLLILGFNITSIAILTSIPSILEFIVTLLSGASADVIIRREYLNVLNTRKFFMILHMGIPAMCLFFIGYFDEQHAVECVILLTVAFTCGGMYAASTLTNIMEISKEHSQIIVGMVTTGAAVVGFIGPLILGALIKEDNTANQWSLMFRIIAAVHIFAMIFFLMFAKAEQQEWSHGHIRPTKLEMKSYNTIQDESGD